MPANERLRIRKYGDGRIFDRKGSPYLWIAYFLRGKEYRESTGTSDPEAAAKFLRRRLKEVGADQIGKATFVGPQQERIKINELLDALEADLRLRDKVSAQVRSQLKRVRESFGAWRAVEVTAEAVDRYIAVLKKAGLANATINRGTQLLSQAFKLAIDRKHLSFAPQIRHLSEQGNARRGFFADAEFNAVEGFLPEYLRDFCRFGYSTGWRKGEIASLLWEDLDGDVIRLKGVNAKNGEARSVALGGALAELIDRRKAARQVKRRDAVMLSQFIFHQDGQPVGDFRKAWATACVAARLGQFYCKACNQPVGGHRCEACNQETYYSGRVFHDLRRTAVRNMVRAGVPERVAMSVSGHKTRSIFDRYNIVNESDLREAMQRTQNYLDGSTKQETSPTVMRQAGGKK
jgi:integrase